MLFNKRRFIQGKMNFENKLTLTLYSADNKIEAQFTLPFSEENFLDFLRQKEEWETLVPENRAEIRDRFKSLI